ncbi:response regulator receiver domain-containing protein [Palleronia aestuarii]|uniref:Response regulator receiver domain-containing protein n=1 Tax=Palleronia aestuarii TaxID=568105 RepID=A0A2W7QCQ2_9RHOB|nr:response regulator [Palleronia aestuarii]PZX19609.1 response regulator receiver domain-containing protein [Palleronia aestuarii]
MTDIFDDFLFPRRPTAERPLLGQTVLVVEDSRVAGETMRLMCLRGGARIRRADSLRSAARHLTNYRPTVVVIDLGLPDGSGLNLIRKLSASLPRVPVLLALSGDSSLESAAIEAGADDFLPKPFGSVSEFHNAILRRLPLEERPRGPREITNEIVAADEDALLDDLALLADLLERSTDRATLSYATNFAVGVGRSVHDEDLATAAASLALQINAGRSCESEIALLAAMIQDRVRSAALAV